MIEEKDFKILRFLIKENGARFTEINNQGFMARSTLDAHLKSLDKEKLIKNVPDKQNKAFIYVATKEGVKAKESYYKKKGFHSLKNAF